MSTMSMTPICIFCWGESGEIIIYDEKSLNECEAVLKVRKKFKLADKDMVFPKKQEVDWQGYHSKCFKRFTKLKKKYRSALDSSKPSTSKDDSDSEDPSFRISSDAKRLRRLPKTNSSTCAAAEEETTDDESETSDREWDPELEKFVEKPKPPKGSCIYCSKVHVVGDGNIVLPIIKTTSTSTISEIYQDAECVGDKKVLSQRMRKVVRYHPQCRDVHKTKIADAEKQLEPKTEKEKEIDHWCYKDVCDFIENDVLKEKQPAWFEILLSYYSTYKPCGHDEKDPEVKLRTTVLKKKLYRTFENKITFFNIGKETVSPDPLPPQFNMKSMNELLELRRGAILLRQELKSLTINKLPEKITVEDLMAGECTPPPLLMHFLSRSIGGSEPTEDDMRTASNLAQDFIYIMHDGEVKPSKHLAVALVVNTLTKNREVVDLCASHGMCCSYAELKELEGRLSFPIDDCPEELMRFVEKQSGAQLLDDVLDEYRDGAHTPVASTSK